MEEIFTVLQRIEIKNKVEKILHVPGNYRGGNLEFAIVFDYDIKEDVLRKTSSELITLLKQTDKIFNNARLNTIKWINDKTIIKEVSAMGMVQMGTTFEDYNKYEKDIKDDKTFDKLTSELKEFYARSKLIIHITNGNYRVANEKEVFDNMHPFLVKKYMEVKI